MKTAVSIIAVLVVLSVAYAEDRDRLGIEVQLVSGVMARTQDELVFQLAEDTKILTKFIWDDKGYLEEPLYEISDRSVAIIRLRRISLASHCCLELEVIARSPGYCQLDFSASDHRASIGFLVR